MREKGNKKAGGRPSVFLGTWDFLPSVNTLVVEFFLLRRVVAYVIVGKGIKYGIEEEK